MCSVAARGYAVVSYVKPHTISYKEYMVVTCRVAPLLRSVVQCGLALMSSHVKLNYEHAFSTFVTLNAGLKLYPCSTCYNLARECTYVFTYVIYKLCLCNTV